MYLQVISFLTVLARYGSLKWSVLKLHALALCNALEESKWKDQSESHTYIHIYCGSSVACCETG